MGDNLPYPAPIRTGREPSAAGAATAAAVARPSGSGQQGNNSNYQIPAHIPPGYVLSSPELYESPSAATRAYQRNTYTTSAGGAGPLSTSGAAASKSTAATATAAAGAAAGSNSSTKGVSTSIAGAATLVSSSSDGQAGLSPLPLSTGVNGSSSSPAGRQRVSWGSRTPLRKDASWFALSILLLYAAAVIYYLYVRIAFTLGMKDRWYSIIVLVVECIGISAVLPYGVINVCHTHPTGSQGLPADDGTLLPDKTFTVRVLVPCYVEPLSVVSATVTAAMEADLPPGVRRELYLCDDGKDSTKRAWLEATYGEGSSSSAVKGRVHYVSGRTRAKGEINGKSANLNNALKNLIYPEYASRPGEIPIGELVVVFDADMQAKPNFFCKLLEVMTDDSIALVLSPQGFSNVDPATDIFNNTNQQFWQYVLPGLDALGYIACTGTNFVLRGRALGSVGWFPVYCITEDYALSMELKAAGFKGAYMAEYLAVGEAPTEMRNVMRQRSRWTKGHMQVFFSRRCPLLRGRLPLLHRLLYTNGTYSYFCTVVTTWTFLLVPFMSLMFQIQPVKFGRDFALAATLYLFSNAAVMNYFHVAEHMRGSWMATVSNYLLAYTYAKAIGNTLLAKLHVKKKAGFKPTEKTAGGGGAAAGTSGATAQIQAALMNRLTSLTRRFNHTTVPQLYQPPAPAGSTQKAKKEDECIPDKLVMSLCLSLCLNTIVLGLHQAYVRGALTAWIMVPIFWAVYNAIPPLLFFGYVFFPGTDSLHNLCFWLQLVSMASGLGAVVCLWFVVPVVY